MLRNPAKVVHHPLHHPLHHRRARNSSARLPGGYSRSKRQQQQVMRRNDSLPERRHDRVEWLPMLMRVL